MIHPWLSRESPMLPALDWLVRPHGLWSRPSRSGVVKVLYGYGLQCFIFAFKFTFACLIDGSNDEAGSIEQA